MGGSSRIRTIPVTLQPTQLTGVQPSRGSRFGHFLTCIFGQPAVQVGRMLGWRR